MSTPQPTLSDLARTGRTRPVHRPPTSTGSTPARLEKIAQRRLGPCLWIATPDVDALRRAYPQALSMGYLPRGTLLSHFPEWQHTPSVHLLAIPTKERVTQVISRLTQFGCQRSRVDRSARVAGIKGFITSH